MKAFFSALLNRSIYFFWPICVAFMAYVGYTSLKDYFGYREFFPTGVVSITPFQPFFLGLGIASSLGAVCGTLYYYLWMFGGKEDRDE